MEDIMQPDEEFTAIEWGLIASLVAICVVGILMVFGPKLASVFAKQEVAIESMLSSGPSSIVLDNKE
jgi:Flp pilus assembly pilin Flp